MKIHEMSPLDTTYSFQLKKYYNSVITNINYFYIFIAK